jgi:hypothetical protein
LFGGFFIGCGEAVKAGCLTLKPFNAGFGLIDLRGQRGGTLARRVDRADILFRALNATLIFKLRSAI